MVSSLLAGFAIGLGGAVGCALTIIAASGLGMPPMPALVVGGVVAIGIGWLGAARWRNSPRAPLWTAGMIAISLAASASYLIPTPGVSGAQPGLRLADGSQMPVRVNERPGSATPLIAIHGGPGIPFTDLDERNLLSAIPDRTIYFYDQVGAGGASRLSRPSRYTPDRAVADLGSVVDAVHSSRVILLGYSDGAGIAARYAGAHPERVAALVLVSPGGFLPQSATPIYGPQSRLDLGDSLALYAVALQPRNLFMYLMTRVDPDAAHWFGSDPEMDARYEQFIALTAGGLHCADAPSPHAMSSSGPPGHYLNQVRQVRPAVLDHDGLARIRQIPMIVFRGECDYIPKGVVDELSAQLPGAQVVELADSGHAILEDRPERLRDVLSSFLDGPTDEDSNVQS